MTVTAGMLRGLTADGITAFHGVPFAAAPVGVRRFRAPEPVLPWSGVRDAMAPGPVAPQVLTPLERRYGRPGARQHEDCLTLSVWTPAVDDAARPVVVWLHGGNFVNGSGCTPRTDGAAMARHGDVVVVGVNYRLGALGYLFLGDVVEGEEGSGAWGLLDQVAALRWVRDEIAAFGGDPDRVTVIGESAGAMSVGALLGTPAATGLFRRAVLQSGGPAGVRSRSEATAVAKDVLSHLDLRPDPTGVAALRTVPTERLLAAQAAAAATVWRAAKSAGGAGGAFAPVVGTDVLPRHPAAVMASVTWLDGLLIGTNADEMRIVEALDPDFYDRSAEFVRSRIGTSFGRRADQAERVYLRGREPSDALVHLEGDRRFLIPALRIADQVATAGVPTWMYEFRYAGGDLGSAHGLEIPFVFDSLDADGSRAMLGEPTPVSRRLARDVCRTWAAFARSGSPNQGGLPTWPRYEAGRRRTMIIDERPRVLDDPAGERRRVWAGVETDAAVTVPADVARTPRDLE
ncbi:carboxylesterase/lipase family protein [Pseudonocardia pini]|uniref:carboxylesterase/lipase family protein n=1 Tax=Pseudonocardia pini TaxID=2758030 RepID=UPI0015F0B7D8|nr:carboxylesterase/lipase family protein [Pseudonocardia pini]